MTGSLLATEGPLGGTEMGVPTFGGGRGLGDHRPDHRMGEADRVTRDRDEARIDGVVDRPPGRCRVECGRHRPRHRRCVRQRGHEKHVAGLRTQRTDALADQPAEHVRDPRRGNRVRTQPARFDLEQLQGDQRVAV